MAKKTVSKPRAPRATPVMNARTAREVSAAQAEANTLITNGLEDLLGGQFQFGLPQGAQLSQTDTLFKNNRWYLVSNLRQLLSEVYVEHGLVATIIDVPVDDGFRGGYDIISKELDAEDIEALHAYIDENGINTEIAQMMKWVRLYGGGGILIMTNQDPATPLNIEAIAEGDPLEFRPVDMWELFWDSQSASEYDPSTQLHAFEHYNFYGKQIHKSRVITVKGKIAPSFIRPRLRGWGLSVVETLVRSINQYLKSNNLSFEVLDEYKLDIFSIKGLTQSLATKDGTEKILRRVAIANRQKNYQNALTMDSEDKHESKQLSFTGIAEVMKEIRMQVASDMRMPQSKLFGISSTGFSSGEDDIEVYNGMVESEIRLKAKQPTVKIVKIACQKLFGHVPEDLQVKFRPMRILSAEQEETVKNAKMTRVTQAVTAGLCSGQEAMEAINRDNLLPVQVDETQDLSLDDGEDEPDESDE